METKGLAEDEEMFFRGKLRQILHQMLLDKPINDAPTYFAVWRQTRDLLEEELKQFVNYELENKIKDLQNPLAPNTFEY